jgi:hypothetical protein
MMDHFKDKPGFLTNPIVFPFSSSLRRASCQIHFICNEPGATHNKGGLQV